MEVSDWIPVALFILTAIGSLVFGSFRHYRRILSERDTDDFRELRQRVTADGGVLESYRYFLRGLLGWADRFFEKEKIKTPVAVSEWSVNALDQCVRKSLPIAPAAMASQWSLPVSGLSQSC